MTAETAQLPDLFVIVQTCCRDSTEQDTFTIPWLLLQNAVCFCYEHASDIDIDDEFVQFITNQGNLTQDQSNLLYSVTQDSRYLDCIDVILSRGDYNFEADESFFIVATTQSGCIQAWVKYLCENTSTFNWTFPS